MQSNNDYIIFIIVKKKNAVYQPKRMIETSISGYLVTDRQGWF